MIVLFCAGCGRESRLFVLGASRTATVVCLELSARSVIVSTTSSRLSLPGRRAHASIYALLTFALRPAPPRGERQGPRRCASTYGAAVHVAVLGEGGQAVEGPGQPR